MILKLKNILEKNLTKYMRRFLCIVFVIVIIDCSVAFAMEIPCIYLCQNEINSIIEKIELNKEPWKTLYELVIADAKKALNIELQSVTYQGSDSNYYVTMKPYDWSNNLPSPCGKMHCDGMINPKADRSDYAASIKFSKAVRDLCLAYALTGDETYAKKALIIIDGWCINPISYMRPQIFEPQAIENFITLPGAFYGASLIWNYDGWESKKKKIFKNWVKKIGENAIKLKYTNNWENWRQVFVASAGALLKNKSLLNNAFSSFRLRLPEQIGSNGQMVNEINRTNSLSYSLFALNAMTQVAEIARHQGIDLFSYTRDGKSLELAWDYYAKFVTQPSNWPFAQIKKYSCENCSLYEIAYLFRPKLIYLKVLDNIEYPICEKRIMGPVGLTHSKRLDKN